MPNTRLDPNHSVTNVAQSNVANARTLILEWEAPNNTSYVLGDEKMNPQHLNRGELLPVIKLYQNGGSEIDGNSLLVFVIQRDRDDKRTEVGFVRYNRYRDLTTAQQRNREHFDAVLMQLEGRVRINEANRLMVFLEGPDVVDLDEAGTTFEVPVIEQRH